jgi:hypothetical protein
MFIQHIDPYDRNGENLRNFEFSLTLTRTMVRKVVMTNYGLHSLVDRLDFRTRVLITYVRNAPSPEYLNIMYGVDCRASRNYIRVCFFKIKSSRQILVILLRVNYMKLLLTTAHQSIHNMKTIRQRRIYFALNNSNLQPSVQLNCKICSNTET